MRLSSQFEILCKRIAKEIFITFSQLLTSNGINGRSDIAGLLYRQLHPPRIMATHRALISKSIRQRRHKFIAHRNVKGGVGRHDRVEDVCRMIQTIKIEAE